jgi:hypothetical protein
MLEQRNILIEKQKNIQGILTRTEVDKVACTAGKNAKRGEATPTAADDHARNL